MKNKTHKAVFILFATVVIVILGILIFSKNDVCINRNIYSICFPEEYAITNEGLAPLKDMVFIKGEEIDIQLYEGHAEETIHIRELFKANIGQYNSYEDDDKWRFISSFIIPQAYIYDSTNKITLFDRDFYIVRYQRCSLPECEPIERYDSIYITELYDRYVLFLVNELKIGSEIFRKDILSTFKLDDTN